MVTTRKGSTRPGRGAAIVEMAIILPILMVLVFGVIEYGWLFIKASQVNNAARQGVRAAIRPDADDDEVEDAIAQVMDAANLGGAAYTVDIDAVDVAAGEAVTVTVILDYEGIDLTGFGLLPFPETVRGEATMSKEGPPED